MKNRTTKGKSPVKIIMISSAAGLIVVFLFFIIFALFLTKTDVPVNKLPYFVIAFNAVGAIISGFICARKLSLRGIMAGLIASGVYSLVILIFTFILSGYTFSFYLPIILIVDLFLGAMAGIAAKNIR